MGVMIKVEAEVVIPKIVTNFGGKENQRNHVTVRHKRSLWDFPRSAGKEKQKGGDSNDRPIVGLG